MKSILEQPGFLAPSGTVGADVSYLLAVVFTGLFLVSWAMAKKAQGTRHHNLILVSMVSMIVYFCAYYYARQLGVLSFEGREGFGGPDDVYENIFVPVLTTHLILVTLGMVFAFYMIAQGFRASEKNGADYRLKPGKQNMDPRRFKIIMFTILGCWALNQALLLAVRQNPFGASVAYGMIFATVALVVSLEKVIEKILPEGARRHRILGRITMVIYALVLITSTATYIMLYFIYPVKHLA
ncbi:MAG: DUF420 domain-containing protein [Nitrospinaceae bacterium]|jgi:uncharacterized membrane protein YozB (DUF420 family)|nr:DUF420 domain-containing protein [Nitrospina sp.]MBT5377120.1 DUF420 domain-containing protein [Nitrospinaceae bacterium]MBT5869533.1 DUF420 domain-containing protein [Nitrospinaceae bacterium]